MAKKTEENALIVKDATAGLVLSQDIPDYLTGKESLGLEALSKEDFNIPQLKLLHPINPEIQQYQGVAIAGEFWHTSLVRSLGVRVPCVVTVARKRVILWRPRTDQGGGILAVSNDGINWARGGNTEFIVNLKGVKEPVKWHTRNNVLESGLLNFGTANPLDDDSPPAANQYYEYVLYLPTYDAGSPVVMRFHKTGIQAARDLNAYFLLKRQKSVPIYACCVEWFVGTKPGPQGSYFIPKFEPKGHVDKATFEICKQMHEQYADIELNIEQEADNDNETKGTQAF